MGEDTAVRWETATLSDDERLALIAEIVSETERSNVLVREVDDPSELAATEASDLASSDPPSGVGPQFADAADPAVVIGVLETAILMKELRDFGVVFKHKLAERLRERGQEVEQVDLDEFT